MFQEFKAFAIKGNVIDLAVAVVIGTAFGKIVSSLVENLITPLVGLFMGGVDISAESYVYKDAVFGYGAFLQAVIDFTIIALVIFLLIKLIAKAKGPEEIEEPAPQGPTEVELLMEIRDNLKR